MSRGSTEALRDPRRREVAALAPARREAYRPEAYAGQESFVSVHEVVALGRAAGIGRGTRVLDLCCGTGGPGRVLARATGCRRLGIDRSFAALVLAAEGARGGARFLAAEVPHLPLAGRFEVVLLVETFLAFSDHAELLAAVAPLVSRGGRFAFTVEEGAGLTEDERRAMPDGETVWPIELGRLSRLLAGAGLALCSVADHTAAHALRARRLAAAFASHRAALGAALGDAVAESLVTSHRLWERWLADRRIRKLAVVCRRSVL